MLKVYADHSATTPLSATAWQAMQPYLHTEYANPSQSYAFSRQAKRALRQARETIANCINAQPNEIYFTSGGTESNNWVLKMSLLDGSSIWSSSSANQLITSTIEHHAILNPCHWLEAFNFKIAYIPTDSHGTLDIAALGQLLQVNPDHNVRLVSIMSANNEVGTIQPLAAISDMVHKCGAKMHSDAVPAIGHIPIDVQALGLDYLSASAHKFNGPKGIGFLYQRQGCELTPLLHGGAQEREHRAGTENVASIIGMACALEENCRLMAVRTQHLHQLEDIIIRKLQTEKIIFTRQGINWLPGLLSISFPGHSGETIMHRLDLQGISISTGSACDSQNTQLSHVLKALHLPQAETRGTVRISLGHENSIEEAEYLADRLSKNIKQLTNAQ